MYYAVCSSAFCASSLRALTTREKPNSAIKPVMNMPVVTVSRPYCRKKTMHRGVTFVFSYLITLSPEKQRMNTESFIEVCNI